MRTGNGYITIDDSSLCVTSEVSKIEEQVSKLDKTIVKTNENLTKYNIEMNGKIELLEGIINLNSEDTYNKFRGVWDEQRQVDNTIVGMKKIIKWILIGAISYGIVSISLIIWLISHMA